MKLKSTLDAINRLDTAEEKISELEDIIENILNEKQRKKKEF